MKENDAIVRLSKAVMFLTISVIVLAVSTAYLLYEVVHMPEEESQDGWCGVVEDPNPYDVENRADYRRAANFLDADFNPEQGMLLTKSNCTACHALTDKVVVGPSFYRLQKRIPQHKDWLLSYLRNTAALIQAGDTLAIALQKGHKGNGYSHNYGNLREDELTDIAGFILMLD